MGTLERPKSNNVIVKALSLVEAKIFGTTPCFVCIHSINAALMKAIAYTVVCYVLSFHLMSRFSDHALVNRRL